MLRTWTIRIVTVLPLILRLRTQPIFDFDGGRRMHTIARPHMFDVHKAKAVPHIFEEIKYFIIKYFHVHNRKFSQQQLEPTSTLCRPRKRFNIACVPVFCKHFILYFLFGAPQIQRSGTQIKHK